MPGTQKSASHLANVDRWGASIDFADAWQHAIAQDGTARLDASIDQAFWCENAQIYDERQSPLCTHKETLELLSSFILTKDTTLLDVGAGTGRFALPLASQVRHITALDHSQAMLEILRQKAQAQHISNITTLHSAWEDASVQPHDIVLAAWSIYRQIDLLGTLQKLVQATRRTLLIVTGDSCACPHQPILDAIWEPQKAFQFSSPSHSSQGEALLEKGNDVGGAVCGPANVISLFERLACKARAMEN